MRLSFQANRKKKIMLFKRKWGLNKVKSLAELKWLLSSMVRAVSMGLVVNIRALGDFTAKYLSAKSSRQRERQSAVGL